MENSIYTKENRDLSIMDLVNLGIVVLISLKNIQTKALLRVGLEE